MRTSGMLVGSAAVALALALTAPLGAQRRVSPLAQDCAYQRLIVPAADSIETRWAALHPTAQLAMLQPLVARGDWLPVLDAVRRSLDSAARIDAAGTPGSAVARLRDRIDLTRRRITLLLDAGDAGQYRAHADTLLRYVGPGVFTAELRESPVDSVPEFVLFGGSADSVILRDTTPAAERRTVCYHAAVMRWLLDRFTGPAREDAAAFVAAKRVLWARYYERGYSQLPWELYVNSSRARRSPSLDPPTTQLVLLHPSVGVELPLTRLRDLQREETIALELVGWLWYRAQYRRYWGLSGVVTFTERQGLGYGPFVHFGRAIKAGYVVRERRPDDGTRRDHGVLVSLDLYRFLVDGREQADRELARIRGRVEAAR